MSRLRYLALSSATILLGLAVHLGGTALAPAPRDLLGDVLWAAMVVWLVSAIAPSAQLYGRAIAALLFCFAIETSQLYHAPWLDAVRATTPGHLVLGSGFEPRDFAAYALGVLAAMLIERALVRRA